MRKVALQICTRQLGIADVITFLHGRLVYALPTQATVDVGGVGYEVFIPLSSYDKLPAVGQPIEILTHLHVREDAQILYGFMTAPERDLRCNRSFCHAVPGQTVSELYACPRQPAQPQA